MMFFSYSKPPKVGLVAFIVHKKRKQTKDRGMDGMEIPTLTPTENVYEVLDQTARDESVLLRTESQVRKKLVAPYKSSLCRIASRKKR